MRLPHLAIIFAIIKTTAGLLLLLLVIILMISTRDTTCISPAGRHTG